MHDGFREDVEVLFGFLAEVLYELTFGEIRTGLTGESGCAFDYYFFLRYGGLSVARGYERRS